jgi:hypothetical protein
MSNVASCAGSDTASLVRILSSTMVNRRRVRRRRSASPPVPPYGFASVPWSFVGRSSPLVRMTAPRVETADECRRAVVIFEGDDRPS